MIQLQTLEPNEIAIIMPRVQDELNARYFYESAAMWCRMNGYDKAAQYFTSEAEQENKHYNIWAEYLADWNVQINFPPIPKPMQFESLINVLEQQYLIEFALFEAYEKDAIAMFPIGQNEYSIIQKFIKIQSASVIESNNLLTKAYNYLTNDPNLVNFEEDNF